MVNYLDLMVEALLTHSDIMDIYYCLLASSFLTFWRVESNMMYGINLKYLIRESGNLNFNNFIHDIRWMNHHP